MFLLASEYTKGDVDPVVIEDSLAEDWEDRFLSATRAINLRVAATKFRTYFGA